MGENTQYKLLKGEPSTTDKFSGGGHERTARSLSAAINSFRGENRSIGLEGAWGSGKSTIVEIANKHLQGNQDGFKYHIFTFDLWANQTGHFKRAFLESFITWAIDRFPSKKQSLLNKLGDVRSRKSKVVSSHYRKISLFGMAVIFLLYLTPVIYAWLTPSAFEDGGLKVFGLTTISGSTLAQFALILFTGLFVVHALMKMPRQGDLSQRMTEGLSRSFSLFNKESDQTHTEQEVRDEDPTQYEFARLFRSIVGLLQDDRNTLVVVFDNIDRLPQAHVAETWAEVRAAINCENYERQQYSSVVSIVPYARAKVRSHLSDGSETLISDDLFRKSFDAIFYVAPAILTEASEFFCDRFSEATNHHFSSQIATSVYRIFELHVRASKRPATPRQVIAFINDCTSYWVQWNNSIPIQTIAIFVAHHEKLFENPEVLRNPEAIDSRMKDFADVAGILRDLAALAYNVDPSIALQVLSRDLIVEALGMTEPGKLKDIQRGADQNGFFELLPDIVRNGLDDWLADPLGTFGRVASNTAVLDERAPAVAHLRRQLIGHANRLEPATPKAIIDNPQIWGVLRLASKEQTLPLSRHLMVWVEASLENDEKSKPFTDGRNWIKIVGAMLAAISEVHDVVFARQIAKVIKTPNLPEKLVGAAYDCDQTKFHIEDFTVASDKVAVASALAEFAQDGEEFGYAWPELRFLLEDQQKRVVLSSVVDYQKEKTLEIDSDQINWSFDNLWLAYESLPHRDSKKREKIEELFVSGSGYYYAHLLHERDDDSSREILASILAIGILEFNLNFPAVPSPQGVAHFGNVQAAMRWMQGLKNSALSDLKLANVIAAKIVKAKRVEQLIEIYSANANLADYLKPIVAKCLKDSDLALPAFVVIAKNFETLREEFADEFPTLTAKLGGHNTPEYWTQIGLPSWSPSLISYALSQDGDGWKLAASHLDRELKAVEAKDWTEALAEGGKLVRQLSARNETSPLKLAVGKFYKPIRGHILNVISGKSSILSKSVKYTQLLKALPESHRRGLGAEIFERNNDPTDKVSDWVNHLEFLFSEFPFDKDADKAISRFLLPLLTESSSNCDQIILDTGDSFAQVLKAADQTLIEQVEEVLQGREDDPSDVSHESAMRLRKALRIFNSSEKVKSAVSDEAGDPKVDKKED